MGLAFTQYNVLTGEIMSSGHSSTRNLDSLVYGDFDILRGVAWDLRDSYVGLPLLTQEPKIEVPYTIDKTTIIADGVDKFTISGLPANTTVRLAGVFAPLTLTDTSLSVTLDEPGTYILRLMNKFKYLKTEIQIDAT